MKASKTKQIGTRTNRKVTRRSPLNIANKDSRFDYSFRRKADIEEGGGMDQYGFTPVNSSNSNGESFSIPGIPAAKTKTRGKNQIILGDTVLCKRPLETKEYFTALENEKYNSQKRMVRDVAKRATIKLRESGFSADDFEIRDDSGGENDFTQRAGPTEEGDK